MKVHGNTYSLSSFVLVSFQEDDLPQFGKIELLIVVEQEAFAPLILYTTEGIDSHYHCFVITCSNEKKLIFIKDLNGSLPLYGHSYGSNIKCVVLRQSIYRCK